MTSVLKVPAGSVCYLIAIADEAADKIDVTQFIENLASGTFSFRVPANTQGYLAAVRNESDDAYDVIGLELEYET